MQFLPTTKKEMERRGWDRADIILFSADAYVDHPSFGAAVIGRLLEAQGYRVCIVPQPDWHGDFRDFKKLGRPRMYFGIAPGCMDSMVNKYTANKRLRSEDAYSPDGRHDMRPEYPTIVYTQILKKLFPDVPVILGGIEASLRRVAHYDYWQDRLRPSILIDSGADMIIYGMGELNNWITHSVQSTSNTPTGGTRGGGGANGGWTRYLGRNAPRGVKIGGGALSAAYGAYTIINSSSNYRESLKDIERNNQLTESEKIEARYDAKLGRNKDIGAGIGSVVGGIAGSFLGPVGTLVGGAIGSAAGKWIGDIVTKDDRSLINNSQVSYNHNYSQMGINSNSQVGYVNNNGVQSIPTVGNSQYIKETATNTFASNNKLSIEPLSLNVNGTIKLTSDKLSTSKIDAEALFKDPKVESMIKALIVDAIQKGAIQPKVNKNSTQAQLGGTVPSPKEQNWA